MWILFLVRNQQGAPFLSAPCLYKPIAAKFAKYEKIEVQSTSYPIA